MERTESSRLMRGAREVFYEYILELRSRIGNLSRLRRRRHVIAKEYHAEISLYVIYLEIVLNEADNASCL